MAIISGILAGLRFCAAEKTGDALDKIFEAACGESFEEVLRDAAAWLSAAADRVAVDRGLEQALHACELLATLALLQRYETEKAGESLALGGTWNEPFVPAARGWLWEQFGWPPGGASKPNHELVAELEAAFDEALSARAIPEPNAALARSRRRVWEALADGAAARDAWRAPDDFKQVFDGDGGEERPGWALVFVAILRESLKKDHKAGVAFLASRLSALRPLQERIDARLGPNETKNDARPDEAIAKLLAALDARGEMRGAEEAGLERSAVVAMARRLRPEEALDLERAIVEMEKAVEIAREIVARGERGATEDEFVNAVLARLAELTRKGVLDEGAGAVDAALAELDRRRAEQEEAFRRQRRALLEAGVEQDILRRDAAAAARRVESIAAAAHPDERPAWTRTFREYLDRFDEEGEKEGVNFSLEIAIALARRMAEDAGNADEKELAANLLGIALAVLGARESGTDRLEEAIMAYRDGRTAFSRETSPHYFDFDVTQPDLSRASLEERRRSGVESGV